MIKFGRPVAIDIEPRLPRLIDSLARDPQVDAVWLFGSRARGEADALSDVDVAVLAATGIERSALWDKQLEWIGGAVRALGTDRPRRAARCRIVRRDDCESLPAASELTSSYSVQRSSRFEAVTTLELDRDGFIHALGIVGAFVSHGIAAR